MPDVHVIPDGDTWNVKQENADVVSLHSRHSGRGRAGWLDWAASNGGGEVQTHRDEGEFSRIRKSDSV